MSLPPLKAPRAPGWFADFKSFVMRGNVVDLAVGIIIGAAFTTIVQSLVKDIFTPLLGLAIGGIDFSDLFITLRGPAFHTLAEAQKAGSATINYGVFLNAVIQFLIVSFAVFWLVRMLSKLYARKQEVTPPAGPTPAEVLLTEIRDLLRAVPTANAVPPAPLP